MKEAGSGRRNASFQPVRQVSDKCPNHVGRNSQPQNHKTYTHNRHHKRPDNPLCSTTAMFGGIWFAAVPRPQTDGACGMMFFVVFIGLFVA